MEAMKEIRTLEEEKRLVIANERTGYVISYKEGEKRIENGYSYSETRRKIAELDARIRKIKAALAYANCTTVLEGFDITIGEGLVMLAQLGAEYERISDMCATPRISRRITPNGTLEYSECQFTAEEINEQRSELKRKIGALQVAIDRANLLGTVDI